MNFGQYRNTQEQYVPSGILATTDWKDLTSKIANNEVDKDYIAERLGAETLTSLTDKDRNYSISKLESEIKNIKGLTKKSRVRYVINKIKRFIGKGGGKIPLPEGLKPTLIGSNDLGSIFGKPNNPTSTPQTSTIPISPEKEKKENRTLLYVGIGLGSIVLIGTVAYFITKKNK